MSTRSLEQPRWQQYFDELSQSLGAVRIDLQIDGENLGAQQGLADARLLGMSYDEDEDVFWLGTEAMEHRIASPQQITVRESGGRLSAVEIVDGEGLHHVVILREAPRLERHI